MTAPTNNMVSCICPTYNRAATRKYLLEEAVEAFLRQTYPEKELLIINDHPDQTIVFEHPQVKVFNLKQRFATLGEKYNWGVRQSSGRWITTHEDDDISLPGRLEDGVKKIAGYSYYNPKGYWYLDSNGLHHLHPVGYAHNCSIYTRDAFEKVGGYPLVSGPQDAHMDGLLNSLKDTAPERAKGPKDWFFIYRWGVSNLHLSGFGNTQQVYDEYAKSATAHGTFVLSPHWRTDYVRLINQYIEANGITG